jgi:23S rRNA pseudouridine2605 synthase
VPTENTIKLQAYIAHQGLASRRKAEELIEQGKVKVNGEPAHIGQRIDPTTDKIVVGGKELKKKTEDVYVLVYKPVGLISSTSDELDRQTVLSMVPNIKARLYPVGRLDKDSEGLMLLTTDGDLTNKLTHPRYEVEKTYHVLIQGNPTNKALDHLRRGVKLIEGYTLPAEVGILKHETGNTWLSITIKEGRNRQVRRMLERVGYPTMRLIRTKLGPFTLEDLRGEKVKQLDPEQIKSLI